ncbi:MAG: NlpC/P60 family protein [Deltaproteobacteria bacterium]
MVSKRSLLVLLLSCIMVMFLAPIVLASSTYYTVKSGDSLWTIARKNNTSVDKLIQLNHLKSNLLQPGMKLLVSGQTSMAPSRAAAPKVNYQPVVSRSGSGISGQDIVGFGAKFLGTPYHYGGASPGGFDCSGFVSYCYRQFGYQLPRTAAGMAGVGTVVSKEELVCGDLVLFQGTAGSYGITHVGIYVGSGQFIHSSSSGGRGVCYSSIYDSYYSAHYYGARRIIDVPVATVPADSDSSVKEGDDDAPAQ